MNKTLIRIILSLLSTCAGFAVVSVYMDTIADADGTQILDNRERVLQLLTTRRSSEARAIQVGDELVREPIPENVARQLFGAIRGDRVVYDPDCYFWEIGNYSGSVRFQEHSSGRWPIETNAQGFRKGTDVRSEKQDLRILITGDSHTAGRVPNAEQFGNVLEDQLAELAPGKRVEALNGGKGAYSFYHYLGVLEKWLKLDPDLFIMTVYGGNDFAAPVTLYRYFNKLEAPSSVAAELDANWKEVVADYKSLVTQDMNQVMAFSQRPEDRDMAQTLAQQATRAIRAICEEQGIHFLVVYIPPVSHVQPWLIQDQIDDLRRRLNIGAEDIQVAKQVIDDYLAFLNAEGIPVINMTKPFKESKKPCYWKSDHHINTRAHRMLADRLRLELSGLVTDK